MAKAKIKRGVPAILKKGGAHTRSKSGDRRKAKNELRRELLALKNRREPTLFVSL